MKFALDKSKIVTTIRVHESALPYFQRAFKEILEEGLQEKADLFGGVFNMRKVRGGTDWSLHAWAIEIDIDPEGNRKKWGPDRWRIDPKVVEIFERNGFFWRGRRGFDAMSFVLSAETLKSIQKINQNFE